MTRPFRMLPGAATIAALAFATAPAFAQKTELLVYTALETDQLKAYTESFQKTNPNIDLKFVRDSRESSPPRCSPRRRIRRPT